MSIETDLKEYIKNKFGSIRSFAFELDVTPSTIYSILKNGYTYDAEKLRSDIVRPKEPKVA